MPYVKSVITRELDKPMEQRLKIFIGDLINELPGKDESYLMVSFHDNQTLYFRGVEQEAAAVIEVKILGSLDIRCKDKFTSKISEIFEQELYIPKENIYVIFEEIPDGSWGWNGELF